jgi:hypothetical protein
VPYLLDQGEKTMHQTMGAMIALQQPVWAYLGYGAIVAVGAIVGAYLAAYYKGRKDEQLAHSRVSQDLQIEYDKNLRDSRIEYYMKLWSCMRSLAKYPEAQLTYDSIKPLSESLRDWYFEGGGLVMTERTRESYFDLQDGLKIILQKREDRWPLELMRLDSEDQDEDQDEEQERLRQQEHLRQHLVRPDEWTAPDSLVAIANSRVDRLEEIVPEQIHASLRSLGSDARTSMTKDVLTRRGSYLGEGSTRLVPPRNRKLD